MKPVVTYQRGLKRERSEDKWEQLKRSLGSDFDDIISSSQEKGSSSQEKTEKEKVIASLDDIFDSPQKYV